MANDPVITVAGAADEQFKLATTQANPPTQILVFNPGFGQDKVQLDEPSYTAPDGSEVDPTVSPYIIRLGAGLAPADIQLVMREDTTVTGGRNVTWEIRVKHSIDSIVFTDFNAPHDVLRGLMQIEFADGTVWSAAQVHDLLMQADNAVYSQFGSSAGDLIVGADMDHLLDGGAGDDTLVSGSGNEVMVGGAGQNVFRFGADHGQDTIRPSAVADGSQSGAVIEFAAGVSRDAVKIYRDHSDLMISQADGSSIRVQSFDRSNSQAGFGIDQIRFADGDVLSYTDLFKAFAQVATEGRDILQGLAADETLSGGMGDDVIEGYGGRDTLLGGDGQDTISVLGGSSALVDGGRGNDSVTASVGTFQYGAAFGQDVLTCDLNSADTLIQFKDGIAQSDLSFYRDASGALVILQAATGDSLRVENFFKIGTGDAQASRIQFADGSFVTRAQVVAGQALEVLTLPDAGESLVGTDGADTLVGSAGPDGFTDTAGSDTYRLSATGGFDSLSLWGGQPSDRDVVRVAGALRMEDVTVSAVGGDLATVNVRFGNLGGLLIRGESTYWTESGYAAVPDDRVTLAFDDGSTLNWRDLQQRALHSSTGNDNFWVNGVAGRYVFGKGDGQDTLNGFASGDVSADDADRIVLTTSDVSFSIYQRNQQQDTEYGIKIAVNGTSDALYLPFAQYNIYHSTLPVIEFPDGSTLSGQELYSKLWIPATTPDGDRSFVGTFRDEYFSGGAGRNVVEGGQGNDIFNLYGAASNTVVAWRGDGADYAVGGVSELRLRGGIKKDDLVLSGLGELHVMQDGREVYSLWASSTTDAAPIQSIVFDDGTTMNEADIRAMLYAGSSMPDNIVGTDQAERMSGQGSNDFLSGMGGNDTLSGGSGQNTLQGGDGDDLLISDGQDALYGGTGNDTYQVNKGASAYINEEMDDGSGDVLSLDYSSTEAKVQLRSWNELSVSDASSGANIVTMYNFLGDTQGQSNLSLIKFNDGKTMDVNAIIQSSLTSTSGDDEIAGSNWSDSINGGAGMDTIEGNGGDDTISGGAGCDLLDGGVGDNIYLYNKGDGFDFISGAAGDVIQMGAGLSANDFVVLYQDTRDDIGGVVMFDLVLKDGSGGVSARDFSWGSVGLDGLPSVKLANGSVLTASDLQARAIANQGTNGNDNLWATVTGMLGSWYGSDPIVFGAQLSGGNGHDVLHGNLGDDMLDGGAGNDILLGGDGNDALTGGKGNDTITCGTGADTVVFGALDGKDLVHANNQTSILLGDTIARSSLKIGKLGAATAGAVVLGLGGTDSITLDNAGTWDGLTLTFADGSVVTGADIMASATKVDNLTLNGTTGKDNLLGGAGNDTLNGLAGNDTLAGGKGDDLLNGSKGNDTYLFGAGDGHDTIVDNDSTWFNSDLLKITGAKSSQLWFSRSGNNLDVSVIGTKDQVTIQDWFLGSSHYVEKLTASDGKSLSASKVQGLVNAMASFAPPAQGQTTLPGNTPATITKLIASSWA